MSFHSDWGEFVFFLAAGASTTGMFYWSGTRDSDYLDVVVFPENLGAAIVINGRFTTRDMNGIVYQMMSITNPTSIDTYCSANFIRIPSQL